MAIKYTSEQVKAVQDIIMELPREVRHALVEKLYQDRHPEAEDYKEATKANREYMEEVLKKNREKAKVERAARLTAEIKRQQKHIAGQEARLKKLRQELIDNGSLVLNEAGEEEKVYTAYKHDNGWLRPGGQVKGTAKELRRQGFRETQFGWTDGPVGNTD